jgi:hypothetical protein
MCGGGWNVVQTGSSGAKAGPMAAILDAAVMDLVCRRAGGGVPGGFSTGVGSDGGAGVGAGVGGRAVGVVEFVVFAGYTGVAGCVSMSSDLVLM